MHTKFWCSKPASEDRLANLGVMETIKHARMYIKEVGSQGVG